MGVGQTCNGWEREKSGYINRKYGEELGKGEISTEGFTRGDFREFESLRSGGGT
jgi:hypothetical protein